MKIAIIGAGGKLGTALAKAAVAKGMTVTGLLRSKARATGLPAGLNLVEGDGRDSAALEAAIAGQDAVVVPAGGRKEPVSAEIVAALLPVMARLGIRRLVFISAYGAIDPKGLYGWVMQNLAGAVSRDKAKAEQALAASGLDWTAVRPPILNDGPVSDQIEAAAGVTLKGMPAVSRADVAEIVIGELLRPKFLQQSPVVFPPSARRMR